MREIIFSSQFKRDLKRIQRTVNEKVLLDLNAAIESLAADIPLQERLKDHPLTGQWNDCRDCHIRPDLLLIYKKVPTKLYLVRIGSHSELDF